MTFNVVSAPELNARFDPRTGTTEDWLGSDCAVSYLLDAATETVIWLWNDTWKKHPGYDLSDGRNHAYFVNNSITVQTGLDLETATLEWVWGPSNGNVFNIPGGTHYPWPQGCILLDGDLYVISERTAISNWEADEGWSVHRIPNILTTDPQDWPAAVEFLYESAPTNCRPTLCLHDGAPTDAGEGIDYIYAFGIRLHDGWRRGRWPKSEFLAGNFTNLKWSQFLNWVTDPGDAVELADSFLSADGSVHQRESDGRYIMVEAGGDYPKGKLQIRLLKRNTSDGNYYPADEYFPWIPLQTLDRCKTIDTLEDGNITGRSGNTLTIVKDFGAGTVSKDVTEVTSITGTARGVYVAPEWTSNPTGYTYAGKAHPELAGEGLVLTYVDLAAGDGPSSSLDHYWPKFVRVLPPTIDALSLSGNTLSWTVGGWPDVLYTQVDGGDWTEVTDPLSVTGSVSLTPTIIRHTVSLKAVGVGGEAIETLTLMRTKTLIKKNGALVRLSH